MASAAAKKSTAYFTFGRFQPPTIGHAALISAIMKQAAHTGGDAFIFVSATYDATIKPLKKGSTIKNYLQKYRNPIPVGDKVAALREMFADQDVTIESRNLVPAIYSLADTYKEIVMVVGSDRVDDFGSLIKSLQGKMAEKGIVLRIEGVARNATNMSASLAPHLVSGTKLRALATTENSKNFNSFKTFKSGVSYGKLSNMRIRNLYNAIRNHYARILELKGNIPITGKRRASRSPSRVANKSTGRLTLKNSPKKGRLEAASPNKHPSPAKAASASGSSSP